MSKNLNNLNTAIDSCPKRVSLDQINAWKENRNLNRLFSINHNVSKDHIQIFFRNLKQELLKKIEKADMVIGATAWITDLDLLEALSQKPTLLVIQKEDFLRPDMETRLTEEAKERLHSAYAKFSIFDGSVVACGPFDQIIESRIHRLPPILCFGYHKAKQMFRTPKMHNKFLTFLTRKGKLYYPTSVWTGSMNLTNLSIHSLENAVVIEDSEIAEAYACEAQIIYLEGQELNWDTPWINPFLK